ncbi:MAG: photosystem reaction center subunit H [Gammaproteobacteria bacterium RIFOXYA12_FULL_61_12]|nr:MAG: photosystem reaction center subunit H [Gammaproteobacteria bacterium RIFOXYA12_FULL_61_12]OGT90963.1 MAG: photosystem reaction center subunit H [Gammaproteobacteria bacterium RIFOXYD12_FULL_61_37]
MKTLLPIVAVSFLSTTCTGIAFADDIKDKQQEVIEKQKEVVDAKKDLKLEMKKDSNEQAQESNKSMQQVSRASKIIGTAVQGVNGDNLGDIKELVLDPESGQVVYAVVSYGGLMSMGDKLFALPWKALHWTRDGEYYTLNMDKATLAKAPGFDKNQWPDSSAKWDQQREVTYQFYRVKP